jgi:hypothetical protein
LKELERHVADLPPCEPEEVTTREAIQIALPQIHAMQSKGYSLDAVANVLSKNGIEVTAVALKRYVQLAEAGRTRGARKPTRATRGTGQLSGVAGAARQKTGDEGGGTAVTAESGATARSGASSRTAVSEPAKKEAAAASTPSRRSAFVSRKDTDDN